MKKLFVSLAAASVLLLGLFGAQAADVRTSRAVYAAPAFEPLKFITCGIWILPQRCSFVERVVGTTVVVGGIGYGVGAAVGAAGYSGVTFGGTLAASKGTAAVALTGLYIGAASGAVLGTVAGITAPQGTY